MSVSNAAGGLGEAADGRSRAPERPYRPARSAGWIARLTDRTLVLMLGVGLGAAIGYAFGSRGQSRPAAAALAQATLAQAAGPAPARVAAVVAPASASAPALVAGAAAPVKSGRVLDGPAATAAPFCPAEPTPQLLQTLQAGGPIRIGVFGDSFGDGVWSALYRRFPRAKGYQVVRFSQPSTGFTRYQQINLEERARAQLAGAPVDVAVVNFGANDDQGLFEGGHVMGLLSPGWRRVYADRAARFVGVLRERGASVYWMGLPRMRDDAYDHDLGVLSATVSGRMASLGVPYIPVRALSVDADGAYSDYLNGPDGQSRLVRATDGVHMTIPGYGRLSEPVARAVEAYLDHARAVAAGLPAPLAANCVPVEPVLASAQPSGSPP